MLVAKAIALLRLPADAADPAWTLTVANTFENVYNYEVATVLGYHAPPPSSPTDGRYDVYLQDLAATNEYGYTVNEAFSASASFPYAATSYIVIDRAYTASVYTGDVGGPYTSGWRSYQSLSRS